MIFDVDPETKDSLQSELEAADSRVRTWDRRAIYATLVFFLACASVSPFLDGQPLHSYWDLIGKYLVLVSMAALPPWLCFVGLAANLRLYRSGLRKELRSYE